MGKTTTTAVAKVATLKPGSVLSESSFFTVKGTKPTGVVLVDDFGNEITIGNEYVEKILVSADYFESEEKKTMTELAELFIKSARIACTVAFVTKDEVKTQKAYNAEVQAAVDKVTNAKVADVPALLKQLIENPVSRVIPGTTRVMKGRHYGEVNDLGRIQFTDMELPKTDSAHRLRWVDPRTIQYLILNKIKYTLK